MLIEMQKSASGVWNKAADFVTEHKNKGLALVTLAAGNAMAAIPADVTTATSDMKADAIALATVFLVASIAVTAFLFLRKGARA